MNTGRPDQIALAWLAACLALVVSAPALAACGPSLGPLLILDLAQQRIDLDLPWKDLDQLEIGLDLPSRQDQI